MTMIKVLYFLLQVCYVLMCNDTLLQQRTCNGFTHKNNIGILGYLIDCYPWIKQTLPDCWNSLNRLLTAYNDSKLSDVCHQQCKLVDQACSMFNDGLFRIHGHCLGKLQQYCEQPKDKRECKNKLQEMKQSHCGGELVDSSEESRWILRWTQTKEKNITAGCSLACDSNLNIYQTFKNEIDGPIIGLFLISILACLFTVSSFLIDWKTQNRYPAIILFILNICFALSLLGWLLQYIGIGQKISCNNRNERRYKEPRYVANKTFVEATISGISTKVAITILVNCFCELNSIWCILSFILIYFFALATACWFVVLNYAWFISFRTMSSIKIIIKEKVKFFHIVSWSIPSALTMMALIVGEIDAHAVTNICFLMQRERSVHIWFVVLPFTASIMIGECLLVQCVGQLRKLRLDCSMLLIPKAVDNISRTLYRLVVYGIGVAVAFGMLAFSIFRQDGKFQNWDEENSKYVRCMLERAHFNGTNIHDCTQPKKARLLSLQLQVVAIFIMCTMTSSWTWTRGTFRIWKKFWKARFKENEQNTKLRMQMNWYRRMNQKKISPFIPPINPDNPLDENNFNFIRNNSKRFSLPEELLHKHEQTNKDIRSVVQLFSKRRSTFGSLHSVHSSDFEHAQKSDKRLSIQSFGHISVAPINRTSSNLTIVQIHHYVDGIHDVSKRNATLTTDEIRQIRDKLYTPLTTVHRDNIVADCIPYHRNTMEERLVSSVIELRKNIRNGRESVDLPLNFSDTKL